jgi:hypothetical protein
MLLQRLRPLLSHDVRELPLKITDPKERHGLRTKNIVIKGFPTVIFCSAKITMKEQEKTRLLLLSPEVSQEKLRESIAMKIERESDREEFYKRMESDPKRRALKERVELVKKAHIKHIKIPEEARAFIYNKFIEDHRYLIPRHQRDIGRLLALIKANALLNFVFRKREGDAIIVNDSDIESGFRLYYGIAEANELGLPPEIFRVYMVLKPYLENNENGITRKEFQEWFFKNFHKPIGRDGASDILRILDSVGLIVEQPDPVDKRLLRYVLPDSGVKISKNDS